MTTEQGKEEYLGDGLYASFDGWMITLRAPCGDGVNHWVGIEPEVFAALLYFAATSCGPNFSIIKLINAVTGDAAP